MLCLLNSKKVGRRSRQIDPTGVLKAFVLVSTSEKDTHIARTLASDDSVIKLPLS